MRPKSGVCSRKEGRIQTQGAAAAAAAVGAVSSDPDGPGCVEGVGRCGEEGESMHNRFKTLFLSCCEPRPTPRRASVGVTGPRREGWQTGPRRKRTALCALRARAPATRPASSRTRPCCPLQSRRLRVLSLSTPTLRDNSERHGGDGPQEGEMSQAQSASATTTNDSSAF